MVLGKLPVPGRPTIWIRIGQGPTALGVDAREGCVNIFTIDYPFSPLSPSLWETARYRLKYCLKGPINPKQPTNQNQTSASDADRDIPVHVYTDNAGNSVNLASGIIRSPLGWDFSVCIGDRCYFLFNNCGQDHK